MYRQRRLPLPVWQSQLVLQIGKKPLQPFLSPQRITRARRIRSGDALSRQRPPNDRGSSHNVLPELNAQVTVARCPIKGSPLTEFPATTYYPSSTHTLRWRVVPPDRQLHVTWSRTRTWLKQNACRVVGQSHLDRTQWLPDYPYRTQWQFTARITVSCCYFVRSGRAGRHSVRSGCNRSVSP